MFCHISPRKKASSFINLYLYPSSFARISPSYTATFLILWASLGHSSLHLLQTFFSQSFKPACETVLSFCKAFLSCFLDKIFCYNLLSAMLLEQFTLLSLVLA